MPQIHTYVVDAVKVLDLMDVDPDFVGRLVIELKTLSGTFSCTPQIKMTNASGTYYNKAYSNFATEVSGVAAGTAITSDGIYEILADGCIGALNFTAVTGKVDVYVRPVTG